MSDFLEANREEVRERATGLRPLVDEFHRLEAADQALNRVDQPAAPTPTRRAAASKPRPGRRGRRGRNTRATGA